MQIWPYLKEEMITYGSMPALLTHTKEWLSYNELINLVENTAKTIKAQYGVNNNFCVVNDNPFFDAIDILSILASGNVAVPISLNYGIERCLQIIGNSNARHVFTNIETIKEINEERQSLRTLEEPRSQDHDESSSSLAVVLYTSGTSGKPKGVMLSHENILSNMNAIGMYFTIDQTDRILIQRSLCHATALVGEFMLSLVKGVPIVYYEGPYSPFNIAKYIDEYKCTTFCTTQTVFNQMMITKKNRHFPTLKKVSFSGEPLLKPVVNRLKEDFPDIEFYNNYGLTEASPRVCSLSPIHFWKKAPSAGMPLNNVSIRVVDENKEELKKPFEIGELQVKGPNVAIGYWKEEQLTAQMLQDGWLKTRDLAYFDEEGFVYIVGRKDDMIIRGGVNIYPSEIENELLLENSILEACVYGAEDELYGQKICLEVIPSSSEITIKEIMQLCRRKLDPYKIPDNITIVKELNRTSTGKLIRGKALSLTRN